jgi:hypothetical protein
LSDSRGGGGGVTEKIPKSGTENVIQYVQSTDCHFTNGAITARNVLSSHANRSTLKCTVLLWLYSSVVCLSVAGPTLLETRRRITAAYDAVLQTPVLTHSSIINIDYGIQLEQTAKNNSFLKTKLNPLLRCSKVALK